METKSYGERVAAEVRAEIARQNTTQRKVANDSGIALSTLNRKLRHGAPFDVVELCGIARALNVPMKSLMPNVEQVAA